MEELKFTVARTIKWNVIDRVSSQLLYLVTGIVLANKLSEEDFGLVGAILVFQAFASLFVDSGFSSALIQRKSPTRLDYSTVLWFNIGMSVALYVILFICAPWIADIFQGDHRLVPLSRVMFLSFIINASSIVQTNRLMKKMDVKMVAVSNTAGLIISAIVGIWLAVTGWGPWAIVWQTITLATVKSLILWITSKWTPLWSFSISVLKGFFRVGSGLMFSSFLNTLFQNVYSFFIGYRVGLAPLGYYTQADKWSKMGIMSLSQVLTASFLPLLSEVQDEPERYARICGKTHRLTSYLLFPCMGLLIVMASPIFHTLFGEKWDPSILLFQILLVRGIFMVLTLQYNNYIISLGKSKLLVVTEIIRDGVAFLAIILTLPFIVRSTPNNIVEGIEILLWGQLAAAIVTWIISLIFVIKLTKRPLIAYIGDIIPYAFMTFVFLIPCHYVCCIDLPSLAICCLQGITFAILYFGVNYILKSKIQQDAMDYIMKKTR
ncbi:MAG: lipopolysaccharide biosynthesis protein [Muribaculum sp.]|nr:lipopolysaccharide biosynthesis protein [Muribaculum sp.]